MTTQSPASGTLHQAADRPSSLREVEGIYKAPPLHWVGDGFRVAGYFSRIPNAVKRLSPFLMLDYHPAYDYPPSKRPRGVGVHPHRGFETVTVAWQGSVAHHDSAGGGGVIGPGDAQWMTAASGVLHKEYHEERFSREGGTFQMAQLWVNLPKQHKMAPPRYQAITAAEMGVVELPGGSGVVRILSGEYRGVPGPAKTFTRVGIFDVRLSAGGHADFTFPSGDNASLLVMKGEVSINGAKAVLHDFVVLGAAGERVSIEATEGAQLLVLTGEPIDEPVVQHGPFVMNTREEIEEAIEDLYSGKFGHLDD
ncbi:MAG: pirin family protein [Polyangiaceae bacterium]|jgi:redox-sensitive bicupin YhaK (pirin superfamily)|nr:pirin family protein [Polyangiaceae bacterium]